MIRYIIVSRFSGRQLVPGSFACASIACMEIALRFLCAEATFKPIEINNLP